MNARIDPQEFGGTEADSTRWPVDIIEPDAYQSRRIVCDAPNTALRYSRRASGVDSQYPGAMQTPIEPMRDDELLRWHWRWGERVLIALGIVMLFVTVYLVATGAPL